MARITVEDCLGHIDNRFDMVLIAAKRAHQLSNGVEPLVDPDNDKATVIALREIAEGYIGKDLLEQPIETPVASDDELTTALMEDLDDVKPVAAAA